ncbi:protein-L-isoaspartate(D-aspartate) O-methyltransferase [Candidatus Bipolaricaulota bacterium]|nr:protein-L-isoaspartate(D-aspartate) O-methyltransferase [Candidatus Bipolaricaulota bacterium]MBS3792849.1 protein-L-isoaspartate(D-aspartate) O-methyltransferase [Candidatus Bipolaricaulota bacterium]
MIGEQLKERGINDERLLDAFRANPRHLFVPKDQKSRAYSDRPLPIGEGQTISQPYIVALMTDLLRVGPGDRVLEIGTGSGYQSAILATLGETVYTVEKKGKLQEQAKRIHRSLGLENIGYRTGDGTKGWKEQAPFEKIIGTGSVPEVPDSLINQLKVQGRLVIPAGARRQQRIVLVVKEGDRIRKEKKSYCSFLPLVGDEGWDK